MRCAPVLVLRASSTVPQVRRQLQAVPADADVVVIREHDGDFLYYVFRAERLSDRLAAAGGESPLEDVVDLDGCRPAQAGQLDSALPAGSVALLGRSVLGVTVDDEPPNTISLPTRGGPTRGEAFAPQDLAVPVRGIPTVELPDVGAEDTGDEPEPTAGADRGLFRAYPDLRAPAQVGSQEVFTLGVGFSLVPPPTMLLKGPPILVIAGPRAEFLVQVTGFGFSFPAGIQRRLVVDRDNPESQRVDFTVRADQTSQAAPRFLEVSYEFEGVVVGRAWVQIEVGTGAAVPTSEQAVVAGSDVVLPQSLGDRPHLSVDIISRGGGNELHWVFHCPYPDIQRPEDITTTLNDDSAQSFALQMMRQVPDLVEFVADTMRGIGRQISDAMPDQFWSMAEQTWKLAKSNGEQPRMQITTTDPWIPWELAWVDKELLSQPEALLEDCPEGATLGELWQIGRWTTPIHRLPQSPPANVVDASKMAVVIGDYEGTGVRELPEAVEEGETLAKTYGALPLDVSVAVMDQLLHCRLQRNGHEFEPTAIHFAGHGRTDVADPRFTGLVLGGGYTLDPTAIRGSSAIRKQRPFVFLNACEAGVGGGTLMAVGGLVGAFLSEGASGFVAPLWRVNDSEAHDIALEFYRRTLDEGQTVGAAMSAIRRRFRAGHGTPTTLAYVFYGDPGLRLKR